MSARHIPLVLKLSMTRTSNGPVLITAVSLQLISLLLILSSKPRNVTLPRPIRLSKWCVRVTQPPPRGTHACHQRQANLPKRLWAEDIDSAVWFKNHTSTKTSGSVAHYERDFIEKSLTLPTRPNGGSKSGSTTPLAPNWTLWNRNLDEGMVLIYWLVKISITVERDVKFVSPTIIVNTLPPTQLHVHNETSTGTASSPTSCSTLSSTTSCGTSTCAKRSKRFSSGASTAPAYFYSRRCTARCFTLYAYRANP